MSDALEQCPACSSADVSVVVPCAWRDCNLLVCQTCSTRFVSPQPTDDRLAQIYGDNYYAPWGAESSDTVDQMKRQTFEPMLEACRLAAGRNVLDLGCATGSFLSEVTRRGGEAYGIDLNPEAIAVARERVPEAHLHAGTAVDDPFPGVTFDAVVMIDFIEHVRDPGAELSRVRDMTAAGSLLVISTPRVDSLVHAASRRHWPQYREEHLTYFSKRGLRALLRRSGFSVVDVAVTRKAITLAYAYGQAVAYPVPLLTPVTKAAYQTLAPLRHRAVRLPMGEMTVVATRDG